MNNLNAATSPEHEITTTEENNILENEETIADPGDQNETQGTDVSDFDDDDLYEDPEPTPPAMLTNRGRGRPTQTAAPVSKPDVTDADLGRKKKERDPTRDFSHLARAPVQEGPDHKPRKKATSIHRRERKDRTESANVRMNPDLKQAFSDTLLYTRESMADVMEELVLQYIEANPISDDFKRWLNR